MKRRPHRSFRMTRRRDYARSLKLPGLLKFTKEVARTLWKNRKVFCLLIIFYVVMMILLANTASQSSYNTIKSTLETVSGGAFKGFWGQIGKAGVLFLATISGSSSASLTEAQQIYAGLIILLVWLTSVWLLRNIMAGRKVKLRDGLYSAGAPIVSTFIIMLILLVQLMPVAIAAIGYSAAVSTDLLSNGVQAMLFWIAAGLLVVLSLYWITSTLFALIIVTLPGMYTWQAIKSAGDIVIGRRLKILLRLLWMAFVALVTWVLVLIPLIIFDSWIKSVFSAISWVPIVPGAVMLLGALTVVWVCTYVYMLYRKVVADEANPA